MTLGLVAFVDAIFHVVDVALVDVVVPAGTPAVVLPEQSAKDLFLRKKRGGGGYRSEAHSAR